MTSCLEKAYHRSLVAVAAVGIGADIVSQSEYRHLLPDFYEEHAGNFGLGFAPALIVSAIGQLIKRNGVESGNEAMSKMGDSISNVGTVVVGALNIYAESGFWTNIDLLPENAGDATVGFLAIFLGVLSGRVIAAIGREEA